MKAKSHNVKQTVDFFYPSGGRLIAGWKSTSSVLPSCQAQQKRFPRFPKRFGHLRLRGTQPDSKLRSPQPGVVKVPDKSNNFAL